MYETPPTGTPPSTTQSPQPISTVAAVSVANRREGRERGKRESKYIRIQRGKYLGKETCGIVTKEYIAICI